MKFDLKRRSEGRGKKMEDRERKKKAGEKEREGSCHKLFYSYPALLMYVGNGK